MSAFRCFGHLDTFDAVAQLHRLQAGKPDSFPVEETWRSGRSLVARARLLLGPAAKDAEILGVNIKRCLPGVSNWRLLASNDALLHEPADLEFFIPLVTNPGVTEYRRGEMVHMAAGSLWWANSRVERSEANWGQTPAYIMVIHVAELPVGTAEPGPGQ